MPHWLDKVLELIQSPTADLRELARIAGADPRTFYRGVDLEDLDLSGQNVEGMEFSGPRRREGLELQLDLELHTTEELSSPEQIALQVRRSRRQEERIALLLAAFLRDRLNAMKIIERYAHDRAELTNDALNVLRDIRSREIIGQRFSDLQIARKVSGRFAKSEDKRSVLAYFFAKHLKLDGSMAKWLNRKSLSRLTPSQVQEFKGWLAVHLD